MQKKNNKLESFLYRTLAEHKYERVRGYESCIVVSEKENKSFKYVVLGDEWIYLTENPPKTIQEAVGLGDVVSVELVNDFPDFLGGEEKRNTQHLAISYWTTEPAKRRSFRKKKSGISGSNSDLHGDRSNASTPLSHVSAQDVWYDEHSHMTQSLTSLNLSSARPDSRGSVSSRDSSRRANITKKKKKASKQLNSDRDTDEMFLKSLKEELEEDILEDIENQNIFDESMTQSAKSQSNSLVRKNSTRSIKSLKSARSVTARSLKKSPRPLPESPHPTNKLNDRGYKTSNPTSNPPQVILDSSELPKKNGFAPESPPDGEKTMCCINCFSSKSKVFPLNCGTDKALPPSPPKKHSNPMSGVHIEITSVSDIGHVPDRRSSVHSSITTLKGNSRADTPSHDDFERRSMVSMTSMSDFGGSIHRLSAATDSQLGFMERRMATINLYLLSNVSPMLMLIRSAWSNFLLTSTLLLNPAAIQTPRSSVIKSSQTQREKTELLFQELKRELLNPKNDMDQIFALINELRIATEKNFSLKKLFWKNTDLFHFFVRTLQHYLPKSTTDHEDKSKRSEEFEFVTLLMEVMCMMFHESEIIPDRTIALKAERGRSVVALLMVLTCTPELAEKKKSEAEKLITEFTKTSLGTVFELFLMAKQANWGYSEGNFFNIGWMVRTLEEIKHTERFVARVISMMMKLISPSKGDEKLSPDDAVLLYRQFFILGTFLEYSPRIRTFICSTYEEEFKYFVQPPAIMKKLPSSYPLHSILLALIEEVLNQVRRAAQPSTNVIKI